MALMALAACSSTTASAPITEPTSSSSASTSCAAAADGNVDQMDTGSYRMILTVGASETMYTQAEADSLKPTYGEIMVSGTMATASGMPSMATEGMGTDGMGNMTSGNEHHVEVSICDLGTGQIVTGAPVMMTVAQDGQIPMDMTVAEMRGLHEATTMTHYGNNVPMSAGKYMVKVSLNNEEASFNVTV